MAALELVHKHDLSPAQRLAVGAHGLSDGPIRSADCRYGRKRSAYSFSQRGRGKGPRTQRRLA